MRLCLAVPTFWTYPEGQGEEEVFYDHPTSLESDGTLVRFLRSALPLLSADTPMVVVAAAAADALQTAVEARVAALLAALPEPHRPLLFSSSQLTKLHSFCNRHGHAEFLDLLSLQGYAAVRNLTLVAANILAADVMVSLDDDEIIADPDFLSRISNNFAKLAGDYQMFGLAGLYENPQGEILATAPKGEWVRFWPKIRWMNESFTKLAASGGLTLTPLALGGNMAVGASLARFLPFDPAVVRGEDIDYVLNARFFQIPFFLDHQLRVVHDPPVKPHPLWRRLRQDLQRFWYTRLKLLSQDGSLDTVVVPPEDLMPYPGNFLTADLEIRAYRAHAALARQYLDQGEPAAAYQSLLNLSVFQDLSPTTPVFQTYLQKVVQWRRLQSWFHQPEVRQAAVEVLWG